jgi:type I restriction enzyme S subunit
MNTYISTENMLPNKEGFTRSAGLPTVSHVQSYKAKDVLVSNIRPYFRKIWFADRDGGCSNDVLVLRASEKCFPEFLYYLLSDDSFFDYTTATAKGTKMPRGDKSAIMQYDVPDLPGCATEGKTKEELMVNVREAIEAYLEAIKKDGEPVPIEMVQINV